VTPRLLRLLEAHGVRATFFLIGRNVERYPSLAAELAARGHELGNHTQNHLLLPVLPRAMLLRELNRAADAIFVATGQRPRLFRPPMGWFSRSLLHTLAEHGYQPVLGDVYPQDCNRPGREAIVRIIETRLAPGSIVILHDGSVTGAADRHQAVDALEVLLPRLLAAGWEVGTVGDLLVAGERRLLRAAAAGGCG
jgi:peptidoglycan/xylan/chitin deacetylase (PgdA/CDA1 family)